MKTGGWFYIYIVVETCCHASKPSSFRVPYRISSGSVIPAAGKVTAKD